MSLLDRLSTPGAWVLAVALVVGAVVGANGALASSGPAPVEDLSARTVYSEDASVDYCEVGFDATVGEDVDRLVVDVDGRTRALSTGYRYTSHFDMGAVRGANVTIYTVAFDRPEATEVLVEKRLTSSCDLVDRVGGERR